MNFFGRKRELAALEAQYRSAESAFVPIYGRRRVGKSELILEFMREHPGIYIVGKQSPAELQARELLETAAGFLDEPLLTGLATDDWKAALRTIVRRWKGDGKLVIALDEFQWMAQAEPALPSILQELWDREWRDSGNVMLILCGSVIGFMEREVLGNKSPLFGRRTAQIRLRPFGFREARAFHPGYSVVDAARAYFICGGIPLYLRAFHEDRSIEMNIRSVILDEFGPLHSEPEFLLREELRELQNYYALLMGLSSGTRTIRELESVTRIPGRSIPYYLDQLIELNYVRRRYPLKKGPPSKRSVRFVLDDPLLRFWFSFVFPHTSLMRSLGSDRAFDRLVAPRLDSWMGYAFEQLCREYLEVYYADTGVSATFEIGEYWDRNVQIDVVGRREDGWVDIGECKWGEVSSLPALVEEVRAKGKKYPNPDNATLRHHLFMRKRPRREPDTDVVIHDLEALYAAPG